MIKSISHFPWNSKNSKLPGILYTDYRNKFYGNNVNLKN